MKLGMAVLSVAALALAACATTGESTSYTPAPANSVPQTRIIKDDLYMARVEHLARQRGIHVTWVNPPTRIGAPND